MDSSVLFGISTVAYILAMMIYIAYLAVRSEAVGVTATAVTVVGFACQTGGFVLRGMEFHAMSGMGFLRSIPLTNLYESLAFFVWSLILIYLVVEFKYKNRSFGAFVTPVAGLALAFIEMSGVSKSIQPLVPALQSNWLLVHVFTSFVAYATFALSFSTGIMYLISTTEKRTEGAYIFWSVTLGAFTVILAAMGLDFLKFRVAGIRPDAMVQSYLFKATFMSSNPVIVVVSLAAAAGGVFAFWRFGQGFKRIISSVGISPDLLDEITYKSIAIGFPIFTLGGLIFGAIWADQAWGVYWSWDPKETWSLITWFVYAFYLHARLLRGWKGHKIAMVAVVGFVAVIITYLGVNLLLSGLHSYGGA
ncbi:MAG: c-type cytochrome biogenesis protein CcsB [Nitrospirota bacterium]|jgi:cytochrome c-type biogenesis protein CcsB